MLQEPVTFDCRLGDQRQILAVMDLQTPEARLWYAMHLPRQVRVVYSDPPWNPGNATMWRTYAGKGRCASYDDFLDGWVAAAMACVGRGATDVLVEQSAIAKHADRLREAMQRASCVLPEQNLWTVYYGQPPRPNALLHFGQNELMTDPTGMQGEGMTRRVFAGLRLEPGGWVCDPCVGLGMISRMAHYFGLSCIGTELNAARLEHTVRWLVQQGYTVEGRAEEPENQIPDAILQQARAECGTRVRGRDRREPIWCDGRVVGFYTPRFDKVGRRMIDPIFVLPEFRRRGLATEVLQREGATRRLIAPIPKDNEPALRCALRAGFELSAGGLWWHRKAG